jgi:hypothetical protein
MQLYTEEELNNSKKPILVCTNYLEMHDNKIDRKPSSMVKIKRILITPIRIKWLRSTRIGKRGVQLFGNPITHPSVMWVMKEMPEICFIEGYKACMDWDLWERLSKQKGEFVYVNDILLYHRMNNENTTAILFEQSNVRYEEELEILMRFWPKGIAKLIMKLYGKAKSYY